MSKIKIFFSEVKQATNKNNMDWMERGKLTRNVTNIGLHLVLGALCHQKSSDYVFSVSIVWFFTVFFFLPFSDLETVH